MMPAQHPPPQKVWWPEWEGSGGEWIHVHMWLSCSAVHLKLIILLTSYTPIKSKKLKKFFLIK